MVVIMTVFVLVVVVVVAVLATVYLGLYLPFHLPPGGHPPTHIFILVHIYILPLRVFTEPGRMLVLVECSGPRPRPGAQSGLTSPARNERAVSGSRANPSTLLVSVGVGASLLIRHLSYSQADGKQ